ncbi:MAG: hypothetical protein GW855_04570 [Erythrobacter sp.]|nr:hypothetical protein [Erythrobacter sp.]NCQ62581.1 hypothetical protein [Alphaproteobacteria bacterium]
MKFKSAFAAAAALTLATAAHAQMGPEVGATIYTADGEEVATIESLQDGVAVVDTGSYTGSIPANALGEGPEGPVISVTKAQLNQLFEQQQAEAAAARDAALVVDAAVLSADGVEVGTVTSIDGDKAIVTLTDGPVALGRDQFATNQSGALIVLVTQEQLLAALNGTAAGESGAATEGADAE